VSNDTPKQQTVIVVDDDVFVRLVISEYLRNCGYRVIECANADEALVILRNGEIKVDIVFSDVEMPGSMDGFALSTWIRKNRAGLDVILAGSVPRATDAAKGLCDEGPVPNPDQPAVIATQIRRLMAARAAGKK